VGYNFFIVHVSAGFVNPGPTAARLPSRETVKWLILCGLRRIKSRFQDSLLHDRSLDTTNTLRNGRKLIRKGIERKTLDWEQFGWVSVSNNTGVIDSFR